MKITRDNIIIYGVVLFGSLIVAVGARIGAKSIGADSHTLSITFWSTIILCFSLYLILQSVIERGFNLLLKKRVSQIIVEEDMEMNITKEDECHKQEEQVVKIVVAIEQPQLIPQSEPVAPITEKISEPIFEDRQKSTIDIDKIRDTHISSTQRIKHEKLQIALDYTQREFAPYVSDLDLHMLLEGVELYSEGITNNVQPVRTMGLTNYDLYHFGWNIYNHFKVMNQLQSAEFIHNLFSFALKDIENANTIRKKFRNEEAKIIKLRGNLSPKQ